MIRKTVVGLVAALAMILGIFAFGGTTDADANTRTCPAYNLPSGTVNLLIGDCADQIAYGGPFANAPAAPEGPYGFGSLNPVAGATGGDTGAAAGGTGGALALTGSESTVLAYFGAGAIAFGAVALGSRRKFFQGALD